MITTLRNLILTCCIRFIAPVDALMAGVLNLGPASRPAHSSKPSEAAGATPRRGKLGRGNVYTLDIEPLVGVPNLPLPVLG